MATLAKEETSMAKIMSEPLKEEIARQMGVYDHVHREGWGAVSSRDCGRMVQTAIEIAENAIKGK